MSPQTNNNNKTTYLFEAVARQVLLVHLGPVRVEKDIDLDARHPASVDLHLRSAWRREDKGEEREGEEQKGDRRVVSFDNISRPRAPLHVI